MPEVAAEPDAERLERVDGVREVAVVLQGLATEDRVPEPVDPVDLGQDGDGRGEKGAERRAEPAPHGLERREPAHELEDEEYGNHTHDPGDPAVRVVVDRRGGHDAERNATAKAEP